MKKKLNNSFEVNLGVTTTNLDSDGVKNYIWPLSQKNLISLNSALLKETRHLIQENLPNEDWHILHIIYIEIIREAMVLLRSAKSLNQYESMGLCVKAPVKHFPYYNAMKNKESLLPVVSSRLSYLTNNLSKPPKHLRPLRWLKLLLDQSVYKRKTVSKVIDSDIVTFVTSNFMEGHVRKLNKNGKNVTLCAFWEWFDLKNNEIPSLDIDITNINPAHKELLEKLAEIIEKHGYPYTNDMAEALTLQTSILCKLASFYRNHLLQNHKKNPLPKILWFGSVNEMRARVLRATVQECGGYTIGHDHGRGFAMGVTKGELGTVFDFCDELTVYSTFVAKQITEYQKNLFTNGNALNLEGKKVKFTGINNCVISHDDIKKYNQLITVKKRNDKPTVMLIAGVFKGEHYAGLNILPPDITTLDFQVRLIKHFTNLGYKVLLKAHPESRISHPDSIFDNLDVERVNGYVEDQLQNVDLIVFDFMSSALRTLVMTQMPMIYFDLGYSHIVGGNKEYLNNRIEIMTGYFDENNRVQIDWKSFKSAVQNAQEKINDTSFLEKSFGVQGIK